MTSNSTQKRAESFTIPLDVQDGDSVFDIATRAVVQLAEQLGMATDAPEMISFYRQMCDGLARDIAQSNGLLPPSTVLDPTPDEEAAGRERLNALLPIAHQVAASVRRIKDAIPKPLAKALKHGRFNLADISSVMVSEAKAGYPQGWHADLVLGREFPPYTDVLGTKIAEPLASREGAEALALRLLAAFVSIARKPGAAGDKKKFGTANAWQVAMRRQLVLHDVEGSVRSAFLAENPDRAAEWAQARDTPRAQILAMIDQQPTAGLSGVTGEWEIDAFIEHADHMWVEFPAGNRLVRVGMLARALASGDEWLDMMAEGAAAAAKNGALDLRAAEAATALRRYMCDHPDYLRFVQAHAKRIVAVTAHQRLAGEALN